MKKAKLGIQVVESDEKFLLKEVKKAEKKFVNSSTYGMGDPIPIEEGDLEVTFPVDLEEDDFVAKNDPRNHEMTTIGHFSWEENGFHVTSRP